MPTELPPETRVMIRENALHKALLMKRFSPEETAGRSVIEIASEIEAFVLQEDSSEAP